MGAIDALTMYSKLLKLFGVKHIFILVVNDPKPLWVQNTSKGNSSNIEKLTLPLFYRLPDNDLFHQPFHLYGQLPF